MKIASIAEVKSRFSAFIKDSEGGPVVVTRNGRPVAVLIGVHDDEEVERLLIAHSPRLREILATSQRQNEQGNGIPHAEFWRSGDSRKVGQRRGRHARRKRTRLNDRGE